MIGESGQEASVGAASAENPAITVVAGSPSPEELAAVTAVLAALEAEEAAAAAARRIPRGQSAWAESQRALRGVVRPGAGQWNRHSA